MLSNNEKNNQNLQPIKSKLLKLREWLTVPETAKHLSIMFGEEVTEADVLRLVLERHIKLSVNFVNYARGKRGDKFIPFNEWEIKFRKIASWQNVKTIAAINGMIALTFPEFDIGFYIKDEELNNEKQFRFGNDEDLKTALLKKLSPEFQDEFLSVSIEQLIIMKRKESEKFGGKVPPSITSFSGNDVVTIKGVWDLPMLGDESLDVEHRYQMLTNGPEITLTGLDGTFVEREDGVIFQVQDEFDNKEWIDYQNSEECKHKSIDFYKKHLDKKIANNEIDENEAKKLLDQQKNNLDRPKKRGDGFFPAGGLPEDSVFVVRTKALLDFQERLSFGESDNNETLEANQKQELGRLRTEKSKWDDSVEISVEVGLFCSELEKNKQKITRDMLTDFIAQKGYGDLPKTTIDKIWKAIPEKYRKKAGRPSNN